jgi:MFS transporter, DHA2 family, methylenomycin A resistance protein
MSSEVRRPVTLIVACTGVLLAQIDTSVVNLAVHRIHAAFGGDPGALRWVVDAYNLVYAAAILSAGALGDRLGRRRMFAIGTTIFTAGSLGCTLAPSAASLIAARAFTGLGTPRSRSPRRWRSSRRRTPRESRALTRLGSGRR